MMEKTLGRYRIVSELGRGGMGVVYRAHEESLNRDVAIKVLGEHLAEDETCVQRFVREAQSAAKLNHPNIVQIYSIDEENGQHYFVMEYVSGTSVYRRIRQEGKIKVDEATRMTLQAAAGLAVAHDAGVVHRDIKPANLMIDDRGLLKIADFGLALLTKAATRLTATGMFMGTPGYLAPEQCLDTNVDHQTDIYSLGVTFFEMLTGVMPFQADSPLALIKQIVEVEPPDVCELNPAVDESIRQILTRMMAKDRRQRYQSCHELIHDLQQYLVQTGGSQLDLAAAAVPVPAASATAPIPAAVPPPVPGTAQVHETAPTIALDSSPPAPGSATPPPLPAQDQQPPTPPPLTPTLTPPPITELSPPTAVQGSGTGSRGALTAILVLLAIGLALVGGATAVAWKTGWLSRALNRGEPVAASTGESASDELPGDASQAESEVTGEELEVADATSATAESAAASGPEAAPGMLEAEPGEGATAAAATSQSVEQQPGTVSQVEATSTSPQVAAASAEGSDSVSRQSVSAQHQAQLPSSSPSSQASPAVPPQPRATGIAVVAVGETLLAGQVELIVERILANRTQVRLVDEKSIPDVHPLVTGRVEPGLGRLIEALRPHARGMLLIRAEYLGERELRPLGRRRDTVFQSRLTIVPFDLESGQAGAHRMDEKVEYNHLTVERKVEELLRGKMRRLLGMAAARR
jgi:serine/threonine-protein kinase